MTFWNENAQVIINEGQSIVIENTLVKCYQGIINCSGGSINSYTCHDGKQLQEWWTNSNLNTIRAIPFIDQKVLSMILINIIL